MRAIGDSGRSARSVLIRDRLTQNCRRGDPSVKTLPRRIPVAS